MTVAHLFLVLAAIFVGTKLLGELAQRLRQPAVLGELIAGVLLGGSVLGIVDPKDPVIHALSEIGVVVLLFSAGLHTTVRDLVRVGGTAATVALAGVVLPFASGYLVATMLGVPPMAALVMGAALCATSVGISARVLNETGTLDTDDGRVVLGAAVIDDVIGLIILSVVTAMVAGASMSVGAVSRTSAVAVGFVVAAVLVGTVAARVGYPIVQKFQTSGTLGIVALTFAFVLAWLADLAGSAMIIGAFAAGLVLDDRHDRAQIEQATATLGHFFVPIFFAAVGAQVDLRALIDPRALVLGAALVICGIAGKVAAGYAPVWYRGRKLLVGVAMVPRGEVGLIFAQMGLATGALAAGEFGAVMLMVLVTTLVVPPALASVARRSAPKKSFFDDDTDDPTFESWPDQPVGPRGTPRGTKIIRPK